MTIRWKGGGVHKKNFYLPTSLRKKVWKMGVSTRTNQILTILEETAAPLSILARAQKSSIINIFRKCEPGASSDDLEPKLRVFSTKCDTFQTSQELRMLSIVVALAINLSEACVRSSLICVYD